MPPPQSHTSACATPVAAAARQHVGRHHPIVLTSAAATPHQRDWHRRPVVLDAVAATPHEPVVVCRSGTRRRRPTDHVGHALTVRTECQVGPSYCIADDAGVHPQCQAAVNPRPPVKTCLPVTATLPHQVQWNPARGAPQYKRRPLGATAHRQWISASTMAASSSPPDRSAGRSARRPNASRRRPDGTRRQKRTRCG